MKKTTFILFMAFAILFTACSSNSQTIVSDDKECEADNQLILSKGKGGYTAQLCGDDKKSDFGDPYIYNDHQFFYMYGDAPGYANKILIHNSESGEYILATEMFWSPNQTYNVNSSNNSDGFAAVLNKETGIGADYTIEDSEVKMTVNGKEFTKKEVTEGKAQNYEQIFDCHFKMFPYEEGKEEVAEFYLADFPEKIICFDDLYSEDAKATGYIDLINNEYMSF